MKKPAVGVIAVILLAFNPLQAQSPRDDLYTRLTTPGKDSVAALETVLKSPAATQSLVLFMACNVAVRENRLEDCAFLYYIAQMRLSLDRALFPPVGTGGDDPLLVFGALESELGPQINPAIMAQPKLFAKVIARVKSWDAALPDGYDPGWSYSKKGDEKQARASLAESKEKFSKQMGGFSTLLLDDAYFAAFKTCQAYNMKSGADKPSKDAFDAALLVLKRIEKEKGIQGFAAMVAK